MPADSLGHALLEVTMEYARRQGRFSLYEIQREWGYVEGSLRKYELEIQARLQELQAGDEQQRP